MPDPRDAAAPGEATEGGATDLTADQLQDSPPADIAAERACAGALLLAPPELARPVLERLADEDLTDPRCRFVVATERRMLAEGVPVDPVTFAAHVDGRGMLEPGPSRTYLRSWLAELTAAAPVPANLPYYADAVIVASVRRTGVETAGRLGRLFVGADVGELAGAVQSALLALLDSLDRCGAHAEAASADV